MRRVSAYFSRAARIARCCSAMLLGLALLLPVPALAQPADPFCAPGQAPEFTHGLATLADQLGLLMGEAVECEHQEPTSGDTLQATTTGLAYYRRAAQDTPIFTDGQSHVALTGQGLIGWDGPSVDAPLSLVYNAALPTWCSWLGLGAKVVGFLCAYPDGATGAWSPPVTSSSAWVLLGIEPSPDAEWQLTAAGRTLLGGSAVVSPPRAALGPPPDTYVQVSVDPINPPPSASFGTITAGSATSQLSGRQRTFGSGSRSSTAHRYRRPTAPRHRQPTYFPTPAGPLPRRSRQPSPGNRSSSTVRPSVGGAKSHVG